MNEQRRNFLSSVVRFLGAGAIGGFVAAQKLKANRLRYDPACVRWEPCSACPKVATCRAANETSSL